MGTKYPTLRQAEKYVKDAIPCDDCDCTHRSARLNVFRDGDTIRASSFRLGCGKVPLVDLGIQADDVIVDEVEDSVEEEVEGAADDGSE